MSKKNGKKGFFTEFKEFITKGNVLDMAVGVVIGNSFKAIVTALTDKVIMPVVTKVLALMMGDVSIGSIKTVLTEGKTELIEGVETVVVPEIAIEWGALIQTLMDFFLVALVLFVIIKAAMTFQKKRLALMEKLKKQEEEEKAEEPAAPAEPSIEEQNKQLLTEIRDLLKENTNK